MGKKLKALYCKVAPPIARISMVCFVIGVLGWIASAFTMKILEDPWHIFYASIACLVSQILTGTGAVLHLVFNIVGIWQNYIRKFIIMLKRNPSVIPLAMMFVSFLVFSLNLTDMSDTTAKIQGKGMGLSQFCIMLFSLLSMVCLLNAFPRRKKANIPMVVLMFVMFGIIIFCDVHYRNVVLAALNRAESPIQIGETTKYIAEAFNMLLTHMILVSVTAALVVLMPVYSKLLKMIKTSVDVEGNDNMSQIEITD